MEVSIKSHTFAPNRTRHRFSSARNVAYQGGTFFVYMVMKYTKQLLSLQQQIDVLKQRGLFIENEEEAKNALDIISYFRLAGYWRLMEADRQQHTFKPNSRFSQIMSLYRFDEELRMHTSLVEAFFQFSQRSFGHLLLSSNHLRAVFEPSPNHLRGYKLTLCSAYATPTLRPCLPLAVIQYNYRIYVQKSKNIAPCAPNRVKPFKTKGLSWGIVVENRAPTAP